MAMQIPDRGVTETLIRLSYPAVFRSKAQAERFARDNHLDGAGVVAEQSGGEWRLVIDTRRAPMLTPWLRQQFPGITWDVSFAP